MADPSQPVAQILRTPINKQTPQNTKNIQWPSFFFSLNPKSTAMDSSGLFRKPFTTPPWTLWETWWWWWWTCFETGSNTSSDLGELICSSTSLCVLSAPPLTAAEPLALLRLKDWARRVIGPEKRGLLTRCETPSEFDSENVDINVITIIIDRYRYRIINTLYFIFNLWFFFLLYLYYSTDTILFLYQMIVMFI